MFVGILRLSSLLYEYLQTWMLEKKPCVVGHCTNTYEAQQTYENAFFNNPLPLYQALWILSVITKVFTKDASELAVMKWAGIYSDIWLKEEIHGQVLI